MNNALTIVERAASAITSMTHADLVQIGAQWLRRCGFGVVETEIATTGTQERADVIGFRSTCSAVIEAKCSRPDFFADARKPFRASGGLGVYRFYLCRSGLIEPGDLPKGWGLLYGAGRSVSRVVCPDGNQWPPFGSGWDGDWGGFQHICDPAAERAVLYSIARRCSAAIRRVAGERE